MVTRRFCGLVLATVAANSVMSFTSRAATVSLRAMKLNGSFIAGTNNLNVAPGDEIEADIYVSGWGAELTGAIRVFQVQLAGIVGAPSGQNGTVLPKGWNAPLVSKPCTDNSDCLDSRYPLCAGVRGCRGAAHNPSLGAWIDDDRSDFIFGNCPSITVVDTESLNYRYTGIAIEVDCLPADTGVPRYVGTLVLVVADNACGTFTFGFIPDNSLIANDWPEPIPIPLTSIPLVLDASHCIIPPIWCTPAHCFLDARIPHSPSDPTVRYTMNTMYLNYTESVEHLTRDDFDVALVPNVGVAPGIASVLTRQNTAVVTLNRRIDPRVWTCIRHPAANRQCCVSSLPADVDGNRIAQSADIFELLDNLGGQTYPQLSLVRCDIDRSNNCSGADLLWEVDLLTGAGSFDEFDGSSLPPCPPMRIDP